MGVDSLVDVEAKKEHGTAFELLTTRNGFPLLSTIRVPVFPNEDQSNLINQEQSHELRCGDGNRLTVICRNVMREP